MIETEEMRARHDERDGFGCLTAEDSGIPKVTDEPGKQHTCSCGRKWMIQEVAGFVVWQPEPQPESMIDKHARTMPEREAIREFLEWTMREKGWSLAHVPPEYQQFMVPAPFSSLDNLIDEFLGIDGMQLERERRALLEGLPKS